MRKKCARCGEPIEEVGRVIRTTWLGLGLPLCHECREEVKENKGRLIM